MSNVRAAAPLLGLLLVTSPLAAEAVEGETGSGLIRRSAEARADGMALIRDGADPKLIVPLIVCLSPPGTRLVLGSGDPGLFLREIIVVDGRWAGCRGVIPPENFKRGAD
jgi:hypothetical protein